MVLAGPFFYLIVGFPDSHGIEPAVEHAQLAPGSSDWPLGGRTMMLDSAFHLRIPRPVEPLTVGVVRSRSGVTTRNVHGPAVSLQDLSRRAAA